MATLVFFTIAFLLIDLYVYQAVVHVSRELPGAWKTTARLAFWIPSILSIAALLWWAFDDPYRYSANFRNWVISGLVATYFSKMFGILFLFVDDLQRAGRWVLSLFRTASPEQLPGEAITRSEFLSKAALVATAVPFGTMAFGIISGAHDYRVRRITVNLPNLPKAFDGIRVGQVSDIHSGSFWNKTAVKGGVEMMLAEKPDLIFFTGDLVNNETTEVKDYLGIFNHLKAPLGVYSVTGNHDYGDYKAWTSQEEKARNFKELVYAHKFMGFRILMNENHVIEQSGERLAILGVENWGAGRFAKYGQLEQAYRGSEESAVKLLLSHDPSHWDAQVRTQHPDIDITFSGHTHGFQFGVELGDYFKWSPSQYAYKQWAGLYREGSQYLYVNRGFGYLGYPGRIGMPPELTVVTLKRA
jgi:hypothetical protein